ncbi:MAG TPA: CPBP family intramembrane glutamic endopeptidase [Anaerolineales bacterium]|nr:CPBP family intramembrane glutamic endopeptidase [Anaerolineales bacterium]
MSTSIVYETIPSRAPTGMGTKTLWAFLALTFGLSWVPMSLFIMFADQLTPLFGEMSATNPVFLLAVYAPGISGIFLVWRYYGLTGLGSFLRRLTLWRAPIQWWLFLLLGIPAIMYAAAAIKGTISEPFRFLPWYLVFPALVQSLLLGPLGEEFGWRGLALPLLQRRFAPFWASLILGVVWALWHAPAFLMSGTPQSAWSFGPFFVGLIAITVIMTPLFNASRGSLLIAILYHLNIMNPIFPDAQPWDSYLLAIAAAVIVFLNRHQMLQRGDGVTDVLMPEDRSVRSG